MALKRVFIITIAGFQREQQQKTKTAFFIISNGKIHQLNEDIPLYNQYGL
jgi:hypothetical protein